MSGFPLFNLESMSGVHPGARTQVFQRLHLLPLDAPDAAPAWALLLWYAQPTGRVLLLQSLEKAAPGWQSSPLLTWTPSPAEEEGAPLSLAAFLTDLAGAGWQLRACATCRHWQPLADVTTEDGLPSGRCTWTATDQPPIPAPGRLRYQSALTLGCDHWQAGVYGGADHGAGAHPILDVPAPPVQPTPAPDMHWTDRIKRRLGRGRPDRPPRSRWTDTLLERSGVGAGTEPCFACQGRLANLGALTVATPEDDKRTFSVWRCRLCGLYLLNDWTDRWERLDNLETEEVIFRLAPGEALALLALIQATPNADHPASRHQRNTERSRLEQFIADRRPLRRQVRQGR